MRRRNPFIARLIDAARGGDSGASSSSYQLPCFPLESHHFGHVVATPSGFHSYLCNRIRTAKERVVLASLYIGVGSDVEYQSVSSTSFDESSKIFYDCKEDELLQSICDTTAPKIQILLDANRAMRRVSLTTTTTTTTTTTATATTNNYDNDNINNSQSLRTNSAEAVYSRINPLLDKCQNSGVFLFPVKDERISRILPSPLDEVAGVFHIKAYIVDDELILSGANLSEEYFSNRLDRYMLFTNGGAGLVDFYANLCDILCDYATRYNGHGENRANGVPTLTSRHDDKARKRKLELALMNLFHNAKNQQVQQHHDPEEENDEVVAWAIPTIQIPTKLLGSMNIPSDTMVTRSMLSLALGNDLSLASVRLCSAYLNVTDNLMSVLTNNHGMTNVNNARASYILTAGEVSHGFSPKRGGGTKNDKKSGIVEYIKAAIPTAFLALAKKTAQSIVASGGKIFLYERPGWIFHAKGIWITINDNDHNATTHSPNSNNPEIIDDPSCLVATIIGSSNFGSRSENLDLESNCILIFNDTMKHNNDDKVKKSVSAEWNQLCEHSNVLNDVNVDVSSNDILMHFLLKFMRRYL